MRAAATPPRRPPSGGLGTVCPPPPSRCTRRKGSQCQREKRRRGAKAPLRPVIWRGGDPSSPEKKPKADAEVEMNGRRGGEHLEEDEKVQDAVMEVGRRPLTRSRRRCCTCSASMEGQSQAADELLHCVLTAMIAGLLGVLLPQWPPPSPPLPSEGG